MQRRWGLVNNFSKNPGCECHTWTQGCMSAVGMEPACATPLLMTHTASAPNSSASCMYSYRPRPAGVNMGFWKDR